MVYYIGMDRNKEAETPLTIPAILDVRAEVAEGLPDIITAARAGVLLNANQEAHTTRETVVQQELLEEFHEAMAKAAADFDDMDYEQYREYINSD
jgi:hypothetical protein